MKLLLVFLSSLLIFSGCSQIKGEVTHEYDEYLYQFNSDLVALGYKPINFSDTIIYKSDELKDAAGECVGGAMVKNEGHTVILVKKSFDFAPAWAKKALIYHELGHCFLGLGHEEGTIMGAAMLPMVYSTGSSIMDDSRRFEELKAMLKNSSYWSL